MNIKKSQCNVYNDKLVVEASDLGISVGIVYNIITLIDDKKIPNVYEQYKLNKIETDRENDIVYWEYKNDKGEVLVIYND